MQTWVDCCQESPSISLTYLVYVLEILFFEWHKDLNQVFGMGWGSQIIDKSFGFDTAVEEAQRAINAAHVEAESIQNGIGLVKLMGRYSGACFPLSSYFIFLMKRHFVLDMFYHFAKGMLRRYCWYQD